jgi:hypothetical protein
VAPPKHWACLWPRTTTAGTRNMTQHYYLAVYNKTTNLTVHQLGIKNFN